MHIYKLLSKRICIKSMYVCGVCAVYTIHGCVVLSSLLVVVPFNVAENQCKYSNCYATEIHPGREREKVAWSSMSCGNVSTLIFILTAFMPCKYSLAAASSAAASRICLRCVVCVCVYDECMRAYMWVSTCVFIYFFSPACLPFFILLIKKTHIKYYTREIFWWHNTAV